MFHVSSPSNTYSLRSYKTCICSSPAHRQMVYRVDLHHLRRTHTLAGRVGNSAINIDFNAVPSTTSYLIRCRRWCLCLAEFQDRRLCLVIFIAQWRLSRGSEYMCMATSWLIQQANFFSIRILRKQLMKMHTSKTEWHGVGSCKRVMRQGHFAEMDLRRK